MNDDEHTKYVIYTIIKHPHSIRVMENRKLW